jgi:transposase InsO family protein
LHQLREEPLDRGLFTTTLEAQVLGEQCRTYYNTERPHSALDYQIPAAFAAGPGVRGAALPHHP